MFWLETSIACTQLKVEDQVWEGLVNYRIHVSSFWSTESFITDISQLAMKRKSTEPKH